MRRYGRRLAALLAMLASTSAGAARLPSPSTADPVTDLALDGDGARLVLFYCANDLSLNQNPGVVIEWNGSSWTTLSSNVTAQCHAPDVVVRGPVAAGIHLTDGLDLGAFCLGAGCSGGADIDQDGLRNVHTPRIGWAFGFPYATYTQFTGALAQDVLYLDPLYPALDPLADPPETTGAFHCESGCTSLSTPTVAGTDAFVFAAYRVPTLDCVAIRWETETGFGNYLCIREYPSPEAIWPEVAVVNGRPVMLWRETHEDTTRIPGGEYTGPLDEPGQIGFWRLIEDLASPGADWDRLRVLSTGTELYVLLRRGNELILRRWNGFDAWTTPWQETLPATPAEPDLGHRDGKVYVAWRTGSTIEVEEIVVPEPSALALGAAAAALLAMLAWQRA